MLKESCLTLFYMIVLFHEVKMAKTRCSSSITLAAMTNDTNDQGPNYAPMLRKSGLIKKLLIGCSFNAQKTPAMHKLESLILLHAGLDYSEYQEVASISIYNGSVARITGKDGKASDFIFSKDESYLHAEWVYPKFEMAGSYKCEARGISNEGEPNKTCWALKDFSLPIATTKSLSRQLRLSLAQCMHIMESHNELNKSLISNKAIEYEEMTSLLQEIKRVEVIATKSRNVIEKLKEENYMSLEALFFESSLYMGRRYYLAKAAALVYPQLAQDSCAKYGGYLAEINDLKELTFVVDFSNSNNGDKAYKNILISGSDEMEEGTFRYARNNMLATYLPWGENQPDGGKYENCLYIKSFYKNFYFYDTPCVNRIDGVYYSYLCEIEER